MNFLAHCLIPDRAVRRAHPDLLAGGFLGDFLKGPVPAELPPQLADGVRLHRRIDAVSNRHPAVRRSCRRFPPELRRFAPVFVDVAADHLLARSWHRFHGEPLEVFTARAYAAIEPHVPRLPEAGRRFYAYMTEEDLLAAYRDIAAMQQGLRSVMRRLKRPEAAPAAIAAVDACLPGLDEDFHDYFPELIAHAAGWLARL
jgi:acyl carrier protein phosphodiesterase